MPHGVPSWSPPAPACALRLAPQQKIADRKSKMLCIELDDFRDVSVDVCLLCLLMCEERLCWQQQLRASSAGVCRPPATSLAHTHPQHSLNTPPRRAATRYVTTWRAQYLAHSGGGWLALLEDVKANTHHYISVVAEAADAQLAHLTTTGVVTADVFDNLMENVRAARAWGGGEVSCAWASVVTGSGEGVRGRRLGGSAVAAAAAGVPPPPSAPHRAPPAGAVVAATHACTPPTTTTTHTHLRTTARSKDPAQRGQQPKWHHGHCECGGARVTRVVAGARVTRVVAGARVTRVVAGARVTRVVAGARVTRVVAGARVTRVVAGARVTCVVAGARATERRRCCCRSSARALAAHTHRVTRTPLTCSSLPPPPAPPPTHTRTHTHTQSAPLDQERINKLPAALTRRYDVYIHPEKVIPADPHAAPGAPGVGAGAGGKGGSTAHPITPLRRVAAEHIGKLVRVRVRACVVCVWGGGHACPARRWTRGPGVVARG
jgi:hypothetical protein